MFSLDFDLYLTTLKLLKYASSKKKTYLGDTHASGHILQS